jgi:hypothetical protein
MKTNLIARWSWPVACRGKCPWRGSRSGRSGAVRDRAASFLGEPEKNT